MFNIEDDKQVQVFMITCRVMKGMAFAARKHSPDAADFVKRQLAELLPPAQFSAFLAELDNQPAGPQARLLHLEAAVNAELTRQAAGQEEPPPLAVKAERKVLRGLAQALKPDAGNGGAVVPLRPVPPTNPPAAARALPREANLDF